MNKTLEKHPLLKELEINNEVEISVEQRHIDKGQENIKECIWKCSYSCAIYLSIEEYFKKVKQVTNSIIRFEDGTKLGLPPSAIQFISAHDNLKPVKPFKFKIRL